MAVNPQMQNPADMDTWWCMYCLCEGVGCASIGSPVCKADQKLCCIKSQGMGDLGPLMGEEGLCLSNQKCFCISQAIQCVPTKPFIEICGKRVFGPAKPGGGGFPEIKMSGNGFGNATETLESCQRDLAQAVANEDFLLANELKQRRAVLIAQRDQAVPSAIVMSSNA